MKRLMAAFLAAVYLVLAADPAVAAASSPDRAYTYDEEYNAVPSTNSFQVKLIIDENSLGCDGFSSAQDLFVDSEDQIYLLDSGKGRVLWIDEDYNLVDVIDSFTYNGEPLTHCCQRPLRKRIQDIRKAGFRPA